MTSPFTDPSKRLFLFTPGRHLPANNKWMSSRNAMALGQSTGPYHLVPGRLPGTHALQLEKAVTNLVDNPSFETATTGWSEYKSGGASGTSTRSSNSSQFGVYALKITKASDTADADDYGVQFSGLPTSVNGVTYTFSCWVALADPITFTLFLRSAESGGNNDVSVSITGPTDGWQRIEGELVSAEDGRTMTMWAYIDSGADPCTAYLDAVQVTNCPSSYLDGSLGDGYSWAGTIHNSESTRAADYLDLDNWANAWAGEAELSFGFWLQAPRDADDDWADSYPYLMTLFEDASNVIDIYYQVSDDKFHVWVNGSDILQSAAQTFKEGDWLFIVVTLDFTSDEYYLYVNGTQVDSDTTALTAPTDYDYWKLGSNYSGTGYIGGWIFSEWFVYEGELTSTQVTNLYAEDTPLYDPYAVLPRWYPIGPFMTSYLFGGLYRIALMDDKAYFGWRTKLNAGADGAAATILAGRTNVEGLEIVEWDGTAFRTICDFKWGGGAVEWNFDPGDVATSVQLSSPEDLTVRTTSGKTLKMEATGAGGDVEIAAADILTLNADKLVPQTYPPCARVYHNADQSIADGVATILAFNSERYDNDSMHDTVTNNSRLTTAREGLYLVTAHIQWEGDPNHERRVEIVYDRGEGTEAIIARVSSLSMSNDMEHSISTVWNARSGGFFEVRVFQNSGGALDIQTAGSYSPEFTLTQLS